MPQVLEQSLFLFALQAESKCRDILFDKILQLPSTLSKFLETNYSRQRLHSCFDNLLMGSGFFFEFVQVNTTNPTVTLWVQDLDDLSSAPVEVVPPPEVTQFQVDEGRKFIYSAAKFTKEGRREKQQKTAATATTTTAAATTATTTTAATTTALTISIAATTVKDCSPPLQRQPKTGTTQESTQLISLPFFFQTC